MGFWDQSVRVWLQFLCFRLCWFSALSHSPELEKDEGGPGMALTPACSHSQLSRAAAISGSLLAALGGKQTESPAHQWHGKFYLLELALSQFSSYEIPSEALVFHACSSWVSSQELCLAAAGENSASPMLFPPTEHCCKWLFLLLLPCTSG